MRNALPAKVKAINNANKYGDELYTILAPIFAPLVGKPILKADGSLLKKVAALLPAFPNSVSLHVYRHTSAYSLAWVVKTCEMIDDTGCLYHERVVYVGDLDGTTLKGISKAPEGYRSDYTVETIQELRRVHEQAKKAASDALSALYPFGEYDR